MDFGLALLISPSVTALPGEKAVIEITREVIVPKLPAVESPSGSTSMSHGKASGSRY